MIISKTKMESIHAPANRRGYILTEFYTSLPYDEEIGWIAGHMLYRSKGKLLKSL